MTCDPSARPSRRAIRAVRALAWGLAVPLVVVSSGSAGAVSAVSNDRPSRTEHLVVSDLARGKAPRVDVLVDDTLLHRGHAVQVELPGGRTPSTAMGTYRGTPIVGADVRGGIRFFAVADDGSATPLGAAHEWYNHLPQLVRSTGHIVVVYQDRGTAGTDYTVLDAANGEEVVATTDDLDDLQPGDREVAARWTTSSRRVPARSRDGVLELRVRDPYRGPAALLTISRTSDGRPLARFAFTPFTAGNPDDTSVIARESVFGTRRSFLVLALTRSLSDRHGARYVVVRCGVGGSCVRTTRSARSISIAGSDPLHQA